MTDRHGYGSIYSRPRSPTFYNPGRTSLPTHLGYTGYAGGYGDSIYPRREYTSYPRSSADRYTVTTVPTTTTKYKVIPTLAEPARSSSTRAGSRSRSATIDSSGRPRLPPIIHTTTVARPASPDPQRTSDDGAYLVPANSHRSHRRSVHSIDSSSAEYRAKHRDSDLLRASSGRESAGYISSRSKAYPSTLVTASDDYMDQGYGYTSSRELAQYDLDHKSSRHSRHRRESSESKPRPSSLMGVSDSGAKSYDSRERGPPPSTRGRDKIATRSTFDIPPKSRADLGYESDTRSKRSRPASMYERGDPPRSHRDDAYDSRDDEVRDRERERAPREKSHRYHHSRRDDEDDRPRGEKHSEKKDHKSRESIAATIGLAATALGLNAASKESERDERDEPSRRTRDDSDEERRRRRRAEEKEEIIVDSGHRKSREKSYRREGGRDSPPQPRDSFSSREEEYKRNTRDREDFSRSPPREKRSSPPITTDNRSRHESVTVVNESKEEKSKQRSRSHSDSEDDASAEKDRRSRREHGKSRAEPPTPTTPSSAFNPKDTMDLRALKEALNRQDEPKDKKQLSIASIATSSSREKDNNPREDDRGRRMIDESPPPKELREPQHQIRVVSPPREAVVVEPEEKPLKGILKAPREKFPEDPHHIREGVAPLKDAKKEGVPSNAKWTKIARELVNPAALEAGKERFEYDQDSVTVLRALSKEEIQAYATITEAIRAKREEEEEERYRQRRAERRERHERHKREGRDRHHRSSRSHRKDKEDYPEESDTTENESDDHVRSIEAPEAPRPRRIEYNPAMMSGGLGDLKENPYAPGTYTGYVRNPPQPVGR